MSHYSFNAAKIIIISEPTKVFWIFSKKSKTPMLTHQDLTKKQRYKRINLQMADRLQDRLG